MIGLSRSKPARTAALVAPVALAFLGGGAPARTSPAQASIDTTIVIRATGSSLAFEPERISAKHGKTVRIRFINDGTLPHNLVVVRDEADIDSLAAAAMRPSAVGYVPVSQAEKLIAYTALASPGETVEVTFVVPPPGEYTYVCLMSGHANSMLGTLRSLR